MNLAEGHTQRLHAVGTRISCYEIEPLGGYGHGQVIYRPKQSLESAESPYDRADADVLEPIGYDRLMARVKSAWVDAGVLWSPPNFDMSAFESPRGEQCARRKIPAASCLQFPPASITGSVQRRSSDVTAVSYSCGQGDHGAEFASSTPYRALYFRAFPPEIMMEVLEHLSSSDLRSFALSSTLCNDLAGRRLWRKFLITGDSTEEVAERGTALLRLPRRANRVISLVIGPGRWAWTHELLHQFQRIWPAMLRLAHLTLNNSRPGHDCESRSVCNLEPLIRGLLPHAQSFRLRSFAYEGWLWPLSPLDKFLCAQPSIQEIFGVDIFATRPLPYSPQFLPSLQVIRCLRLETALHFVQNRPIRKLYSSDVICRDSDLTLLTEALETCKSTITELSLSVLRWPSRDQLRRFAKLLREVRKLTLCGTSEFSSPFPVPLPELEELICLQIIREYEADPVRVTDFASQFGPKLCRVFIYAGGERHTWLKRNETECVHYGFLAPQYN